MTFRAGGGEMGALMRDKDWSATPLGPPDRWPQSLRAVIRILLTSRYAMWMGWGQELTVSLQRRVRGDDPWIASDGPSALRLVRHFKPSVALLDIGLPGMDGYELAARLRSDGLPSLRLIAVTGYGQVADRERSEASGFDAHLVKPVDVHEKARTIRVLMENPR